MINKKDSSELVLIPAGTFLAGEDKHEVTLPAYYLGKYAVTNRQWDRFCRATNRLFNRPKGKASQPVVLISWHNAQAYCAWAGLRLPTEMEWEKGARGTDGRVYPWGNEWDDSKCRHWNNKGTGTTCKVSDYPEGASPYGLLNMSGNVWEWCEDRWDMTFEYRVMCGGSWYYVRSDYFRAACRCGSLPDTCDVINGFRVAKTA